MKEAFAFFFLVLFSLSAASLLLGLIRPVYVLWFLDRFNRLKVIKIYGFLALVTFLMWKMIAAML